MISCNPKDVLRKPQLIASRKENINVGQERSVVEVTQRLRDANTESSRRRSEIFATSQLI